MGNLLRRYWTPALLSSELPEADCPPMRDPAAGRGPRRLSRHARARSGCSRRRARTAAPRMFFGRNEEAGLRCVYHGWKFDVTGRCVDMPSEPAESNFKNKVRITAYPTHESGGIVWTYMGPTETMPAFRDLGTEIAGGGRPVRLQGILAVQLGPGPRRQHRYGAHLLPAPVPRHARHPGRRHRPRPATSRTRWPGSCGG